MKQSHLKGERTQDREGTKPARMHGSEIMRSDEGPQMPTICQQPWIKETFAKSKAACWFLE
jgi:hypothetical protein